MVDTPTSHATSDLAAEARGRLAELRADTWARNPGTPYPATQPGTLESVSAAAEPTKPAKKKRGNDTPPPSNQRAKRG